MEIRHKCPSCGSTDLTWSQYWVKRRLEHRECTCNDCNYKGDWEEFCLEIPVVPDISYWVSEGLLYDIKDYLERVNDLGYLVLNCDDLIEKINEVLDK